MSDTDAEIDDFLPFLRRASGRVLIAGLGMGLLVENLLKSDEIEKIVVVEIDKNVVRMTGRQITDDRLHIIQADFLKWIPEENFDFGWYDIWDNICGDNAPQMREIKRRLRQFVKRQLCWCEQETIERE